MNLNSKKGKSCNKKNNQKKQVKQNYLLKDVLKKDKNMYVRVWQNNGDSGGMTSDGKVSDLKKDTLIYTD